MTKALKTAALRRPIYVVQVDLDSDGYKHAPADVRAFWLDICVRKLAWHYYYEDEEDAEACIHYMQAKWSDACVVYFPKMNGKEMPRLCAVQITPLPF